MSLFSDRAGKGAGSWIIGPRVLCYLACPEGISTGSQGRTERSVQSVLLAGIRFRRRQMVVLPLEAESGERGPRYP
jgi:hypothetical protein